MTKLKFISSKSQTTTLNEKLNCAFSWVCIHRDENDQIWSFIVSKMQHSHRVWEVVKLFVSLMPTRKTLKKEAFFTFLIKTSSTERSVFCFILDGEAYELRVKKVMIIVLNGMTTVNLYWWELNSKRFWNYFHCFITCFIEPFMRLTYFWIRLFLITWLQFSATSKAYFLITWLQYTVISKAYF